MEERHTGLAEGRHKAAVGDILVRAAVAHMGADRSPAAEVEHHNRPGVEELRSHPAEVGSLLEAGIPGFALVEVGRMAAVAGMESLMVGGTGRNRAERILLYRNCQFSCQGEGRLGIELEVDKVVLTALVWGVTALLSWGRIIRHVEKIWGSESWETVRLE